MITQIRVGKLPARREDEYLGHKYGLIGQETTGVGGMAKALRTIPVMLELFRDIQELAPDALVVNFTNPSGLITEALSRYGGSIPFVGLCNSPVNAKMMFLDLLQKQLNGTISADRVTLDTPGDQPFDVAPRFYMGWERCLAPCFGCLHLRVGAGRQPYFRSGHGQEPRDGPQLLSGILLPYRPDA